MKLLGRPAAKPPPAAPAGGKTPPAAAAPPTRPAKGFRAAFTALVERKAAELKGRWAGATSYQKEQEAKRRAASEMARRIERASGKRPTEGTIRRNAGKDATPRGGDQRALDRQAVIDGAGGITQFAKKAKINRYRATKWLHTGQGALPGPPSSPGIATRFSIVCDILHISPRGGETPETGRVFDNTHPPFNGADLVIPEPDASTMVAAHATGDDDTVKEILAEQMERHVAPDFYGPADVEHRFTVTAVNSLDILG